MLLYYRAPLITSKIKALSTHLLEVEWEAKPSILINHSIYPKHYATSFLGFLFLRLLRQSSPEIGKCAKDISPFAAGGRNTKNPPQTTTKKPHTPKTKHNTQQQKTTWIPPHHIHHLQLGNSPQSLLIHILVILKYISNNLLTFTEVSACGARERWHCYTEYCSSRLSPFKVTVIPKPLL